MTMFDENGKRIAPAVDPKAAKADEKEAKADTKPKAK